MWAMYEIDVTCPSGLRGLRYGKPVGRIDTSSGTPYYRVSGKRIHRIIWEKTNGPIPEGMEVDHINRNSLDNRIENLRVVSKGLNMRNKPCQSNNCLGEKNIQFTEWGTYRVRSTKDGKTTSMTFKTLEEAILYRDAKEAEDVAG